MNDTKRKIQEMMKEEAVAKRREQLEESRSQKSKGKDKKVKKSVKDRTPINEEHKKLIRSIAFVALFLLISLGLFYAASIAKTGAQENYQQQLETNAKKTLQALMTQSILTLSHKINNLNYILKDAEYIKNFNNSSWQSILKTELAALLGNQAVIEIVPENFNDDNILDNPELGYAVLSLLNELKTTENNRSASHLKIEVHRANSKNARMMMVRKVTFLDVEQKKDVAIGYIIASLSPVFLKELLTEFNPGSGYIEIVQKFAGKTSVLEKAGDASLKSMPLVVAEKMNNTQWTFRLWPAEQRNELPGLKLWQAMVYLVLGSLAFVSAIVLLVAVAKKHRKSLYVNLPSRKKTQIKSASKKETSVSQASSKEVSNDVGSDSEVANIMFNKGDGIAVEDSSSSENEYMNLLLDKVFRAYDIRGIVGEQVDAELVSKIAYAIAKEMTELKQSKIAVGYDGRTSSPELFQALTDALLLSGIDVIDIGMVSSPVLYFAAITKAGGNGVIITASHNPSNYNGMKIMLAGHSYSEKRLANLKQRILYNERVSGSGTRSELNVMEDYFSKILANVVLARPMNIVIDTGHGVTGKFAKAFFEKIGCKVTALNVDVDGNFPAHEPDPSRPENLSQLIQKVTEVKADIGIAFDGDGDRIGLIASGGEIIWPDRILMLLAKDILSRNKEATILYDVKSSGKLESFISEHSGKPMMCQSGHSFMKSKLLETGALLAGEMSGHIFIKDRWYGFDDGLYVAARILEVLSIDLRKSRQVFAELPDSLNTPEILIATDKNKQIMAKLTADSSQFSDGKLITIDGLRVEYPDGWGLVRASNTSDNLTMRFEADNEEALQRIANKFKTAILSTAPELQFPF